MIGKKRKQSRERQPQEPVRCYDCGEMFERSGNAKLCDWCATKITTCPNCGGDGVDAEFPDDMCEHCDGQGEVLQGAL